MKGASSGPPGALDKRLFGADLGRPEGSKTALKRPMDRRRRSGKRRFTGPAPAKLFSLFLLFPVDKNK
jgi:hypothetical protein